MRGLESIDRLRQVQQCTHGGVSNHLFPSIIPRSASCDGKNGWDKGHSLELVFSKLGNLREDYLVTDDTRHSQHLLVESATGLVDCTPIYQ